MLNKNLIKFFLLLICVFTIQFLTAQSMDKKSLLADLNSTENVKLDSRQKKDYESINNKLADDLVDMDKKSNKQDDRDKEVDRLFDRRDNDIDKMFGNDKKFEDTRKELKKTSNHMRRKIKLTKLVL
jgi:hypothetical protein